MSIWGETRSGGFAVMGHVTNPDGTEAVAPFVVAQTASGTLSMPFYSSMTALSNGNVAVGYRTEAGMTVLILDPAGHAVGVPAVISGHVNYERVYPSSDGGFVFIRLTADYVSPAPIAATAFDATGHQQGATFHASSHFINEYTVQAAVGLSGGGWLYVWEPPGGGLVAQRFDASGATVGATYDISQNAGEIRWNGDMSATRLADGHVVVAWSQADAPGSRVIHTRLLDATGHPLGAVETITPTSVDANNPVVAARTDGGYAVSWYEGHYGVAWDTGSGTSFHAQVFDGTGHAVGAAHMLGSNPTGFVAVASPTAHGGIAFAWRGPDASGNGALFSVLNADGSVAVPTSVLNAGDQSGSQYPAKLMLSDDGHLYAGWVDQQTQTNHVRTFSADITQPTVACYCTGTLILTDRGQVPVEALSVGDHVVTASGEHRPIRWIGHRRTEIARHPQPGKVMPILIRAGAVSEGVPARDLRVSPGHAVAIDGVLVKAERLVNGATIVRESLARTTYWHVELDSHDLLVAEGLAAESYVECGNRHAFANGGPAMALHPEFDALGAHAAQTCLPLVDGGEGLAAIRARLVAQAGARFSADPAVTLLADGIALEPVSVEGRHHRFAVPERTRVLRLVSRSAVACEARTGSTDRRRLGIAVRGLTVDGVAIACDDLGEGWYAQAPGRDHRWSDGDAALPLGREIAFAVFSLDRYPVEVRQDDRRAA